MNASHTKMNILDFLYGGTLKLFQGDSMAFSCFPFEINLGEATLILK